jgi:hypothetical protein
VSVSVTELDGVGSGALAFEEFLAALACRICSRNAAEDLEVFADGLGLSTASAFFEFEPFTARRGVDSFRILGFDTLDCAGCEEVLFA